MKKRIALAFAVLTAFSVAALTLFAYVRSEAVLRAGILRESATMFSIIVFHSSKEEQGITGYRLGANSYIRKPVNFDQFMEAVRQLGLYWLVLNETLPAPGSK